MSVSAFRPLLNAAFCDDDALSEAFGGDLICNTPDAAIRVLCLGIDAESTVFGVVGEDFFPVPIGASLLGAHGDTE